MSTSLSLDFFNGGKPVALLVGGAGFVGSHLSEELISRGVKVICFDTVSENIQHLLSEDFVYRGVEDIDDVLLKIERADYVFFLTEHEGFSPVASALIDFSAKKQARLLFGSDIRERFLEEKIIHEASLKKGLDFRRVHWLDVYGPKMSLSRYLLGQILKKAASRKTLQISGTVENFVYPVFVQDVVEGILKAEVSPGTKGMLITFAGEKTSVFNFAESVKNLVGNIEVQFVARESPEEKIVPAGAVDDKLLNSGRKLIGWETKTPLLSGLRQTLSWFDRHPTKGQEVTVAPLPKINKEEPKPVAGFWEKVPKKKRRARWLILPLFGLTILFWIFFLPALQLGMGIVQLKFAENTLKSGETKTAAEWFERSLFWFELATKTFPSWGTFPGLKNEAHELSKKSNNLVQVARLGTRTTSLIEQLTLLQKGVLGKEVFAFEEVLANVQADTETLVRDLGFLEAEMQGVDLNFTLPVYGTKTIVVHKTLDSTRTNLAFFQELLLVLPDLLGANGKRTYMVVMQDNTELTPSGGRIYSFGLLTFDKGRLINFEVVGGDVAEGQLKGHIDPPEPLGKYADLASWNLSYSGWSADFPTSAARAAWFVEKELEQKVDGVAAYDLEFVKALLADNREIELESGEAISTENIYQITEKSGKDYYINLNRAVLRLLTNPGELKILELAGLGVNTEQKHLAFWTTTSRANTILAKYGWDGGVRNVSCDIAQKFGDCRTDYLQIVDANLGNSKASRLLQKSYALEIDIKDEVLSHRITISLENKGQTQSYRSYLRLLTPATAKVNLSVVVNPEDGKQENISPDIGSDKGKRSFGTLIEIPGGQKRQIVYLWDVPHSKSETEGKEGELVFLWQKQMGTFPEPVVLRVNMPEPGLKVGAFPSPGLTENGTIGYNTSLFEDLVTNLIWQGK